MGTFLATAARCVTTPAVRLADGSADWCAAVAAARRQFAERPVDAAPVAIDAAAPLAYAAQLVAAWLAGRDVLLANPRWTTAERAAAERLRLRPFRGDVRSAASPRVLIATGGSGGTLRFATHSVDTLAAAAHALQRWQGGGPVNSLCLLPLHHVSGLQQLIRALATAGELFLGDWPALAAGRRPELPPRAGGWMLSLVPSQLQRLVDDSAACAWLRGFGTILLGGAPAGAGLLARARAAQLPIAIAYGASETAAVFAAQSPESFLRGETGLLPLSHATVRILDPDTDAPLAAPRLGRIEVAAPSLFLGYWPEQRPAGPLRTDDLGFLDATGRLHVAGRADAAINTGGEKVHPAEVEAALQATGAFSEVVVCGAPDDRWGERVVALYPAADDPDLAAVERALRATLSPHKLPKSWLPVDGWPRTAQGKTDRAALRRLAT